MAYTTNDLIPPATVQSAMDEIAGIKERLADPLGPRAGEDASRQNGIPYSCQIDKWTMSGCAVCPDSAVAPNGTPTADRLVALTAGSPYAYATSTVVYPVNTPVTYSVYLQQGSAATVDLYCQSFSDSAAQAARITWSTQTIALTAGAGISTCGIQVLANGWVRAWITRTLTPATGPNTFFCIVRPGTDGGCVVGDWCFVWGAQCEPGLLPTDPIATSALAATQTVAPDAAVLMPSLPATETPRTNLLLYSEDFSNAAWSTVGIQAFGAGSVANEATWPDPGGGTLADQIVVGVPATQHYAMQSVAKASLAGVYCFSIWLAGEGTTTATISLSDGTNGILVPVTFASGAVGAAASFGSGFTLLQSSAVKQGIWVRVSMTVVSTNWATIKAYAYVKDNTTYAGDGTSSMLCYGAQLEQGTWLPTAYLPTLGAAASYPPPTRTNAAWCADLLNATAWQPGSLTLFPAAATNPGNGKPDAWFLRETSDGVGTPQHTLWTQSGSGRFVADKPYCFSIYLKAAGRTNVQMSSSNQGSQAGYVNYDLAGQTASYALGSVLSYGIAPVGGGWVRIWYAVTAGSAGAVMRFALNLCTTPGTTVYSGGGTLGVLAYGPQIDQGSAPTAFSPSQSATGTWCQAGALGPAVNLLPYPEQIENVTGWTLTNATAGTGYADPQGGTAARKAMETAANGAHVGRTAGTTAAEAPIGYTGGTTNCVTSLYAKAAERTKLLLTDPVNSVFSAKFDLATGIASSVSGCTAQSYAVTDASGNPTGWWRLVLAWHTTGTMTYTGLTVTLLDGTGASSYAGDASGTYGLLLYGAQVEMAPSPAPYTSLAARAAAVAPALYASPQPGEILILNGCPASMPASGTIGVGRERIRYSSRTYNALTVAERGAEGTAAGAHALVEPVLLPASAWGLARATMTALVGDGVAVAGQGAYRYQPVSDMAHPLHDNESAVAMTTVLAGLADATFSALQSHIAGVAPSVWTGVPSFVAAGTGFLPIDLPTYLQYANDKTTGKAYACLIAPGAAYAYWLWSGTYLDAKSVFAAQTTLVTGTITAGGPAVTATTPVALPRTTVVDPAGVVYTQGVVGSRLRVRVTKVGVGNLTVTANCSGTSSVGDYFGVGGDSSPATRTFINSTPLDMTAVNNWQELLPVAAGDRAQAIASLAYAGTGSSGAWAIESIPDRMVV